MKALRFLLWISFCMIFFLKANSQPVWISGPTSTSGVFEINLSFTLNENSKVYYAAYPFLYNPILEPSQVKTLGIFGNTSLCDHGIITYSEPGNPATITLTGFTANSVVTIFIVAESDPGGSLQSMAIKLTPTTLPCPPPYILTGFPIPTICVNKATTVFFTIENADANPFLPGKQLDPDFDGIYAGTDWSLDWGDGTVNTFESTVDNEIPSDLSFISHLYAPNPECVIEIELTITNPCGRMSVVSYPLDLHSRDHFDLNGVLRIEENLTGLTTIQVCEGNEHHITLRDNSIWNCQPPVPIPGRPNLDPRTIQWIYGESNEGTVINTIGTTLGTGVSDPVVVGGLHNATTLDGYIGNPIIGITSTGELSEEIVIPASCRRDEYFDVYLLNWNKCNPYGTDEPVYTSLRIIVVAAPAPPAAPNRTICLGDVTTLTAAHGNPTGTILTWYANENKSEILTTGETYSPLITLPGTYIYYVADEGSVEGNLCEGPVREVTLEVQSVIHNNTIATAQTICSGETPSGLTGSSPTGGNDSYTFLWQVSTVGAGGPYSPGAGTNTNQNYSPPVLAQTTWFRRVVTSGPCSNTSTPVQITVNALPTISTTGTLNALCYRTSAQTGSLVYASSSNSPTSYSINWTGIADQGNTPFAFASGGGTVNNINIPAGTPPGTYNGTMTIRNANECTNTHAVNFSVNALPTITTPGNVVTACYSPASQNTSLTYTATSNNPNSYSIEWTGMNDQSNTSFAFAPGGGVINNIVIPAGTVAGTYNGTLTIRNANGCTATRAVNVTVNRSPVISMSLSDHSICSGNSATITLGDSYSGTTYQLRLDSDDSNVGAPVAGTGGPVSFVVSPLSTTTYNILARIEATGCQTEITDKSTVTVNPAAPGAAGPIAGFNNVCYEQSGVVFSVTAVPNASNYVWSVPGGVTIVSGQGTTSLTVNFLSAAASPVTISVYPENGCGQGGSSSKLVNIYNQLTGGSIAGDQTICYDEDVSAFTNGSSASGGAGTFTYTWLYTTNMGAVAGDANWTEIPSANSTTYNHGTLTITTRFVRRAIDGACATPVYSNIVTITVRPQLNGGTIAGDQTICYNGDVSAFTSGSSAGGGAGTFTYTWQYTTNMVAIAGDANWTDIPSGNSTTYNHGSLTTTTRFIRRAIDGTCTTPVYSNIVQVTVRPQLFGGSIAGDQTICYNGDVSAFTNSLSASGGAGTFTYTWQYTTNMGAVAGDANWSDIPSSNSTTYSHGTLSTTTRFIRRAIEGTCTTPVYSNIITVTVWPQLNGGSISPDQAICYGGDVPAFTNGASASGGAGAFTYTWQYTTNMSAVAGDANWTNIPSSNSSTYNHGTLTTTTRFIRRAIDGTCTTPVYSNILTVNVLPALTGGAIGTNQTICSGTDVAAFTSIVAPSGGNNTFTYTWQSTNNMSAVPGDANWTDIPGSNSIAYDYGNLNAATKFVRRAVDITCNAPVWSNMVTISINPLPVTSPISGDDGLCDNETNKVYQVESSAGSTFDWTVPSGLVTKTFDTGLYFILVDAVDNASGTGAIQVVETITATGCMGAPVTFNVTISPVFPGEDITGPDQVCQGAVNVPFSITEGEGSTYSWVIPAGASISNDPGSHEILVSFSMPLTGTISVVETTIGGCTTVHNPKTVVINSLPAVYNLTAPGSYCVGENGVTVSLSDSEAGVSYQLFKNGVTDGPALPGDGNSLEWPGKEAGTYIVVATNALTTCSQQMNGIIMPVINLVDGGAIGNEQTICENISPLPFISITNGTGTGFLSYQWKSSTDNAIFYDITGATSAAYRHGTLSEDTYFKRIVYSTLGTNICEDESSVVLVTINNLQPGSISGDQTICEGEAPASFGSTAATSEGSIAYQWKSSQDGIIFTDIADATAETYNPAGLVSDTWYKRIAISVVNDITCVRESNVIKVTVNNVNPGSIIADQILCIGANPVSFWSAAHGAGDGIVTYQWQSSTDGLSFTNVAETDALVYDPPVLSADTWFRRVTTSVMDLSICARVSNVVKVTVNNVTGGIISENQTICSGAIPTPFTSTDEGSGTGTVTYQWLRSDNNEIFATIPGATDSDHASGTHYFDTWYKRMIISLQNGVLCTAESNTIKVTVNPLPIAMLSGGATICTGESAILKVNLPAGLGPFEVEIENHGIVTGYSGDADIIVTPVTTTTYRLLRVKDSNGCEIVGPNSNLIGIVTITVNDPAVITQSPVSRTICEYGATTFSVTAAGYGLEYQWYVDKGSGWEALPEGGVYFGTTSPILNIFGGTRDLNGYLYHAVVDGCGTMVTSDDAMLTVDTPPSIEVQPVESTICQEEFTTFSITANGTALTYEWQVNSGSGFANITDGGVYSGATTNTITLSEVPLSFNNYIFRVKISGQCPSPAYSNFVVLSVTAPPIVTLHPVGRSVCDGAGTVNFSAFGSGLIDSLRWQVNSGGIWTDIYDNDVYSGSNTQQLSFLSPPLTLNGKEYRLALKAACIDIYTDPATLTVNSNPEVTFPTNPLKVCGGDEIIISPVIADGSGTWTQHAWAGDIGPLNNYFVQSPVFNSLIAGSYDLIYKVKDSNGCSGTDTLEVKVDSPDATFTQDLSFGCTPLTVKFTKDMTGIAGWTWDFGDGSPVNTTDASPTHIYKNTTPTTILYYTVTLTVQSAGGCTATKTSLVTVYPSIDASFTADKMVICHGETITFTTLTGASVYTWDYGDGTTSPGMNAATHLFTNSGLTDITRTITLKTSSYYGCIDAKSIDIVVRPRPVPEFSISPNPPIQEYKPAGSLFSFTNGTSGTFTWSWTFGDGGTSIDMNPTHTYTLMGDFNVTLEATNGTCTESIARQVSVTPKRPVADFDSIPSGCEPLTINFNNTSLYAEVPETSYKWDFGDGVTSIAKNPVYTYFDPGVYVIRLTVTGPGGVSEHAQIVHVYPTPIAAFDIAPTIVYVNDEKVRAFNLSTGADYYVWEWGDGDTSKTKEPFHKYMESGVYDISLSAYKDNGNGNICYDKYTLSPGVTVEPAGELRFATVFRPNLTGPEEVTDLPTGEKIDQFFFPPIRERVINYKLQIFNRMGVLIFESRDINIPWNGYYKGQLCPQGVYVWFVEGKYSNGQVFKKVGDITLLH